MIHPARIFFSPAHPLFSIFDVDFIVTENRLLVMKFFAQPEFVDRVDTGHLHSGFCTLILDTVMGGSVMGSLDKIQPIATINLTTQHSHRALLDEAIMCSAQVERIEDQVAIVTGRVTRAHNEEVLANAVGSFMIATRTSPLSSARQVSPDKMVS